MTYYKLKPEYDNHYINPMVHDANIFVADELLTRKEYERLPHRVPKMFDIVNINPKQTYKFFGVRFAV